MKVLSVLIPSIPEHRNMLLQLLNELNKQISNLNKLHPSLGEVEVLVDDSKRFLDGGLSIGKKREALVSRASGRYLCFCDCDDVPAPNYIETLVRLCHHNKDVVTFRDFTKTDFYWTIINMSLFNIDEQATPEKIVNRGVWLVCPVRSEYAKQFQFPDTNYGEDAEWMSQVLTLCETEVHTDQILRSYQHSSKTSEADRITRHEKL